MNRLRCKFLAWTLFYIPIGAFAQTPAPSPETAGKQLDIGRMPSDVQAAVDTLNAIRRLLAEIRSRRGQNIQSAVPPTDRAYKDVTVLLRQGIVRGYPYSYFDGRRTLTRYEFAVALQRALSSFVGYEGMRPEYLTLLSRLYDQFYVELEALGMDPYTTRRKLDALWKAVAQPALPGK